MKTFFHAAAVGGALSIYLLAGAAAFAQPIQGPRGRSLTPSPHDVLVHRPETQAERARRLRETLQLRPAQEPALQAYVAALDAGHHGMAAPPHGPPGATTPERLDRMQQMMSQHHSAAAQVIDATRRFYAQLDPAQKRAYDAMPMQMPHHAGHLHGHGHGGGDHLHHAPR